MAQDVLLDRLQGGGRVQPEFGGQVPAPRPGGGQRFGVPAGPVESLHEQASGLLPFRMLGQERPQGGDGLFGPAE